MDTKIKTQELINIFDDYQFPYTDPVLSERVQSFLEAIIFEVDGDGKVAEEVYTNKIVDIKGQLLEKFNEVIN